AKEIGCSKSTIGRFISDAKGTLTHEQVLKIARLFNVSTDFLLGETNIPDRKNYDIAELGLSVEAAKNLYTGRSIQRWSTCCWKTPALQSLLTA
ncbi:helix-turn-helix protein, partial [human gut metagenome]